MEHRAKKSLGQNFLKSKEAIRQIIGAAQLTEESIVLEVGPGKGVLTKALLEHSGTVIAVEADGDLIPILSETFAKEIQVGKLKLIHADIMEFDPGAYGLKNGTYTIIANIPYYITGALFRKFLSGEEQPGSLVFLVQKEVAERIVVRDGKESILSISVKAYGTPVYIAKVSKRFFSPMPKVDSAIIAVHNISRKNFANAKEEENFFTLVRAGFAHKRKLLIRNLENMIPKEKLRDIFAKNNINEKARAEDIGISEWLQLTKETGK